MFEIVNLLMLKDAKKVGINRLINCKEVYQLKNMNDDLYQISPFNMLSYRGNLSNYLIEHNIELCYIINDQDLALKELYGEMIRTYDKDENNNLTRHNVKLSSKKYVKTL